MGTRARNVARCGSWQRARKDKEKRDDKKDRESCLAHHCFHQPVLVGASQLAQDHNHLDLRRQSTPDKDAQNMGLGCRPAAVLVEQPRLVMCEQHRIFNRMRCTSQAHAAGKPSCMDMTHLAQRPQTSSKKRKTQRARLRDVLGAQARQAMQVVIAGDSSCLRDVLGAQARQARQLTAPAGSSKSASKAVALACGMFWKRRQWSDSVDPGKLSPPMAMPSYSPSVARASTLYISFDMPPDLETKATEPGRCSRQAMMLSSVPAVSPILNAPACGLNGFKLRGSVCNPHVRDAKQRRVNKTKKGERGLMAGDGGLRGAANVADSDRAGLRFECLPVAMSPWQYIG